MLFVLALSLKLAEPITYSIRLLVSSNTATVLLCKYCVGIIVKESLRISVFNNS